MWTLSQRKALLALCLVTLGYLTIESWRQPVEFGDPAPDRSLRGSEIVDRVDPNTAGTAALAAIPNIGEKRAAQIVDFRERYLRAHPNSTAYHSVDDLRALKGFGPATAANLAAYLVFERDGSELLTQPASPTTK